MPTTYSARAAVAGVGKQTAEGSALTVPKFEIPMGGGFIGPTRVDQELPWTFDSQDPAGHYIERVSADFDLTLPLLPKSSATLLESVLGSRSTSGAGPYTHVLTPADSLSFYSWFFRQPGDNYWTATDAKSGNFQISWSPGSPLSLSMAGMAKAATRAGSKWSTATVIEAPPTDPFFKMQGSTIKFDVDSATPVTVNFVSSGNVSVNRNIEAIQTDGTGWRYMAEQKRDISVSLDDVVLEDNSIINTIFTGTSSGTSLSTAVVYGSFEATFLGSDDAVAATRSLKMAVPNVLWRVDQIPSADPSGGVTRYTIAGSVAKASGSASITCTVINAESGANY